MLDQGVLWVADYSQNARDCSGEYRLHQGATMATASTSDKDSQSRLSPQIFWLKLVMFLGFGLFLFGHYLWVGLKLPETMGVSGIMIVAGCCAFGLILSLPTKIYLTLLLMQREAVVRSRVQSAASDNNNVGSSNNDAT